jgi:hypothetical protein
MALPMAMGYVMGNTIITENVGGHVNKYNEYM